MSNFRSIYRCPNCGTKYANNVRLCPCKIRRRQRNRFLPRSTLTIVQNGEELAGMASVSVSLNGMRSAGTDETPTIIAPDITTALKNDDHLESTMATSSTAIENGAAIHCLKRKSPSAVQPSLKVNGVRFEVDQATLGGLELEDDTISETMSPTRIEHVAPVVNYEAPVRQLSTGYAPIKKKKAAVKRQRIAIAPALADIVLSDVTEPQVPAVILPPAPTKEQTAQLLAKLGFKLSDEAVNLVWEKVKRDDIDRRSTDHAVQPTVAATETVEDNVLIPEGASTNANHDSIPVVNELQELEEAPCCSQAPALIENLISVPVAAPAPAVTEQQPKSLIPPFKWSWDGANELNLDRLNAYESLTMNDDNAKSASRIDAAKSQPMQLDDDTIFRLKKPRLFSIKPATSSRKSIETDKSVLQPLSVSCRDLNQSFPALGVCQECSHGNPEDTWCRFAEFRRLKLTDEHELRVAGFRPCAAGKESDEGWLRRQKTDSDERSAAYILQSISGAFTQLLKKERWLLDVWRKNNSAKGVSLPLAFRESMHVREMCDACQTTLYNLHMFCVECGMAVCARCVEQRNMGEAVNEQGANNVLRNRDRFGWLWCTKVTALMHFPARMHLACLIPDLQPPTMRTLCQLDACRRVAMQQHLISPDGCVCHDVGSKHQCRCEKPTLPLNGAPPPYSDLCDGRLLVLHEPDLALFQQRWKDSLPIIVTDTHKRMDPKLWTPEYFRNRQQSVPDVVNGIDVAPREAALLRTCVVDCKTGKAVGDRVTMSQFWDGYDNVSRRQTDGQCVMYLKLKDYPPNTTFKEELPGHFVDFCRALPVPEYTSPELEPGTNRAQYNLVTRLPDRYLKPDMGPKMYTAYGMLFHDQMATTNLHCDMTDAVNLMADVTIPEGVSSEYTQKTILRLLVENGLSPESEDYRRVECNWAEAGAIWSIFRPEDSEAVAEFIKDLEFFEDRFELVSKETLKSLKFVVHGVHDQQVFLTPKLRVALKERRGIDSCTFVQMKGDAVFIPAGAAHQVQNLLSCIKVAEDFVSPEGVQWSMKITEQLSRLTEEHLNHEDKLQLVNIIHHSVCDTVAKLLGSG